MYMPLKFTLNVQLFAKPAIDLKFSYENVSPTWTVISDGTYWKQYGADM